jgi:CBS domain-containing protein
MRVSEIMVKNPIVVDPDTNCTRLAKIMRDKEIGSLVLVNNNKPIGIVTERDLVHRVMATQKDPKKCKANDIASKPVIAVSIHADIEMAVDIMNDYKIRRIVVVDDKDKLVGILTTDDLAKNLRSMSEELAVKYIMLSRRTK